MLLQAGLYAAYMDEESFPCFKIAYQLAGLAQNVLPRTKCASADRFHYTIHLEDMQHRLIARLPPALQAAAIYRHLNHCYNGQSVHRGLQRSRPLACPADEAQSQYTKPLRFKSNTFITVELRTIDMPETC